MEVRDIVTGFLISAGCFFILVASIGVVRFPDFYSRTHPASKADTLGQALVFSGLMTHEGLSLVSAKLLLIIVFIFIANPTATHAIVKAAYIAGVRPWSREDNTDK